MMSVVAQPMEKVLRVSGQMVDNGALIRYISNMTSDGEGGDITGKEHGANLISLK